MSQNGHARAYRSGTARSGPSGSAISPASQSEAEYESEVRLPGRIG
jgi:hypothetical protein